LGIVEEKDDKVEVEPVTVDAGPIMEDEETIPATDYVVGDEETGGD
jgi:hypothetical protein